MIPNRLLHITVLVILIAVASFTDLQAKSVEIAVPIKHYIGTSWRVTNIDGDTYDGNQGPIIIRFTNNGIFVDQRCLPFIATPQQDGKQTIRYVNNSVRCFMIPPAQTVVAQIFENLSGITPMGKGWIRLSSTDGGYLIAVRDSKESELLPSTGKGLVVLKSEDDPFTIKLGGSLIFRTELAKCSDGQLTYGQLKYYWFEISWGDGSESNLNTGPQGQSCADIAQHTYARSGTYRISVHIGTLGPTDGPLPIFEGKTSVTVR